MYDMGDKTIGNSLPPVAARSNRADFRKFYANHRGVQAALRIFKLIGLKKGSCITEVGPDDNSGQAIAARGIGAHYLGFDLSSIKRISDYLNLKMIRSVLDECEGSTQIISGEFSSDCRSVSKNIPDDSQDCVLMITGVLSDPFPESSAEEVFTEALRVIKPGGKIVVGSYQLCWGPWGSEQRMAAQLMEKVLQRPEWKGKVELKIKEAISLPNNAADIYEVVFSD